ncbi:MAG: DMT family transporter, partial [Blastocatellia bacterium]|nr:DMT family transporter [Blastocatellia bacterium]
HILAVILAACGFGLLTLPEKTESINFGDLITAIGTIFWALHIVYTGLWAKRKDTSSLLLIQLASGTFIFSLSLFLLKCLNLLPTLTEDPSNLFSINWMNFVGLIYLSVFATLITIFVQISAQRHISATRAAIIFSLEPGFAAIFSYLVLGERLSFRSAVGGLLIIAAIMLSEVKLFKIKSRLEL